MAGNTLLTNAEISEESCAILVDHGDTLMLVRREDRRFTAGMGETYSMRVPERVKETTGRVAELQGIAQSYQDITINQQQHQAFPFTVQERSLSIENMSELIIQPRISQIAAGIESDIHSLHTMFWQSVGTAGTAINTFALFQQGSTKLRNAGNAQDAAFVMNPSNHAGIAEVLHDLATPSQGVAAEALTRGRVARTYDYERGIYVSNAVRMHTNGAFGDSTPLTNGTTADGATQVVTNGWASSTGAVAVGDVFTMGGVYAVHPQNRQSTGELAQFVVTAAATADSADMTISISPTIVASGATQNVSATPANDAALTFIGSASVQYPQNLVLRPDAIALAMVDQNIADWSNGAKSEFKGVRLATLKYEDGTNHQIVCRVDCIYGRTPYQKEALARHWG